MAKIKSTEILSLDKTKQKKVLKEGNQLKKKMKNFEAVVDKKVRKPKTGANRGLIYVAHIPHGFYEEEMRSYFKQFGAVTNVTVCRSSSTGNSKGYGYVEFLHPEVAEIAAETMNNYLMFKKRVTATYVPFEKRPKGLFLSKVNSALSNSKKARRQRQHQKNLSLSDEEHLKRTKTRLSKLAKRLEKLEKAGISCKINPSDVPKGLVDKNQKTTMSSHVQNFGGNDSDSEVEFKMPLKKIKKSVKTPKPKTHLITKSPQQKSKSKLLATKTSKTSKTLDAVKALVSSKKTEKTEKVSSKKSGKFIKVKSGGITKKNKAKNKSILKDETLKKFARELKKTKSDLLATIVTKKSPKKKTPSKKNITKS